MQSHNSIFEAADLAEMAAVLGESFTRGEPMASALGMTAKDIESLVLLFGPKADLERVSVVARDSNRRMVGALLAQDFAGPPPSGMETVTADFQPIGALLDGLDESYRQGKTIRPGEYLHLFMLGVLSDHEGKRIGHNLVTTALKNGFEMGYRMAVTEATGSTSQHIFRQLGFVDRLTVRYSDYVFDGRPVFSSIKGHIGAILMDKELT
jgi:ribosomal protein S18 acetylase RimI-like enzyme